MVQNIALEILNRLEASIAMENQIVGMDERAEHSELQSCLLGVLVVSLERYYNTVELRVMLSYFFPELHPSIEQGYCFRC